MSKFKCYLGLFTFLIGIHWIMAQTISANEIAKKNNSAVLKDIKQTLGIVPTFLKQFPAEALPGAWEDMKMLQLSPDTALSGKEKELIGLAVSAQIPCKYCTLFHTEAAKLNKASVQEIREAVAMAAITRKWSTVLNGNMQDFNAFKAEADKALSFVKMKMQTPAAPLMENEASEVYDGASSYNDIAKTFGMVPTFLKQYPEAAIPGAWKEMKGLQLSNTTALSGKLKELIGVAVASQIPCQYCNYFHSQAAMLNGAKTNELQEAIAIASTARHWSTYMNGLQMDEAVFKKEVQQIMQHMKTQIKMHSASNN